MARDGPDDIGVSAIQAGGIRAGIYGCSGFGCRAGSLGLAVHDDAS